MGRQSRRIEDQSLIQNLIQERGKVGKWEEKKLGKWEEIREGAAAEIGKGKNVSRSDAKKSCLSDEERNHRLELTGEGSQTATMNIKERGNSPYKTPQLSPEKPRPENQ
ncbi:hypothetical protein Nepgr_032504 [Nepenthes gracilis]|uniref:Uncharacterized protein n=1 Tax=Nepenthes gracilis TaxID=150966 RepID=A0AAD3Y8C4_NEPGR|nr:hypothetical protein Nepgr_032504 [Nepenthes gracilis]